MENIAQPESQKAEGIERKPAGIYVRVSRDIRKAIRVRAAVDEISMEEVCRKALHTYLFGEQAAA